MDERKSFIFIKAGAVEEERSKTKEVDLTCFLSTSHQRLTFFIFAHQHSGLAWKTSTHRDGLANVGHAIELGVMGGMMCSAGQLRGGKNLSPVRFQ